jgi:hypothetical protein
VVSKAIILGLATKRKEKKRKENAHGIAQIPPYLLRRNTRLEQGDTRGGAARRGLYRCYQTGCAGNRGTCCHYCHGFPPTSLRAPKRTSISNKTATKCSRNRQKNTLILVCRPRSLSRSLSLSLSFLRKTTALFAQLR